MLPAFEPWGTPVLRWAGSKRKLLPELSSAKPPKFKRYIEPFAGSACFFFAIYPERALLGDANLELIQTYATLRDHPRLVSRRAAALPRSRATYNKLRKRPFHEMSTDIERAASFVYLNRYCFNGVWRTNRQGLFNVPMGTHTGELPGEASFYRCSVALRRAELMSCDFAETCSKARQGDFVYLDPPYSSSPRDRYGEYGYNSFEPPDLHRIVRVLEDLDRRGCSFLLSYVDNAATRTALCQWSYRRIRVRRHVAGFSSQRTMARELLVANYVI